MFTFNVPASVLKAAAICAPVKADGREYLNGVHVRRTLDGRAAVTSTDGHVLFHYVIGEGLPEYFPDDGIIIPIDVVRAVKATKKQLDANVLVALDGPDSVLAFRPTGARLMFTPLEGKFPAIAGLWPANVEPGGPGIYLDPALVKRTVDAMTLVAGENWSYCYGSGCLFLSSASQVAHCITMGMRRDNEYSRPIF